MKSLITKLNKDEKGYVFTVVFLLILPLLLFLVVSSSEITRTERATNETLQQALSNAVNDAAHMIDKESQAMGQPRIDYERAFNSFKSSLMHNLALIDYQNPSEASSIKGEITYWFLVYNGDNNFKGYKNGKVASYAYFTNENGFDDFFITDDIVDFPQKIDISEKGFVNLGGRNIQVTLEHPSVIAIVTTNINSITGKEGESVSRWAKAEVVKRKR